MRRPKSYYFNLLFYTTIAIVLTILILSAIFYVNFENITSAQIYSYMDTNLNQLSQNVDSINSLVKNACVILYSDRYLQKFLFTTPPSDIDIINGLDQLENYRFITNFISSIYLYNNTTKTFYMSTKDNSTNLISSKEEFFDTDIIKILDNYTYGERLIPIPRRIPIDKAETSNNNHGFFGYSYVFFDSFSPSYVNSAVVVNIPEKTLLSLINKGDNAFNSTTIIINKNGELMINTPKNHMGTNISSQAYISTILQSQAAKGQFIDTIDGVKSNIVYYAPDKTGWRYISITPYTEITKRLNDMRNRTVGISLSILLLGILIASFISKRLYNPVKLMASNIDSLESEQRDSFYTLRQDYLRNFVLEYNNMEPDEITEKFKKFRIYLPTEARVIAILFRIDNYQDFCNRYNAQDKNLMKFAIMNISAELVSGKLPNEAVDMGDDHILLLALVEKPDFNTDDAGLTDILKEVQTAVLKHINISVSITVSTIAESMEHVSYLYYQVLENSFHRLFYGKQSIILSDKINSLEEKDFEYQMQLEKYLIESLMLGNIDDAKKKYGEIIEYISGFSYAAINMAFSHLVFNIKTSLDTLQKNNFVDLQYNFNIVLSLNEYENIEDINNYFYKVFEVVAEMLDEKKNKKYDEMLQKVNAIIEKEYMNQSLSIDFIADVLGYSSNYIGRLYKKYTAKTIPDVIMEVRMRKAKELLSSTDMQIARISEITGFTTDGYFYKAFKKENGITPSEYRKNSQAKL